MVFLSYLDAPLSQVTGEAGPWHKNGRWGAEDGTRHPITFGPLTSRMRVLPGAEMEHPLKPESIPSDGVRRQGKKDAASAATKQATQGKGLEGTKRREKKQIGDKMR